MKRRRTFRSATFSNEFEKSSRAVAKEPPARKPRGEKQEMPRGPPAHRGIVVGVSGDFVLIDYGGKSEGVIPAADLLDADGNLSVKRRRHA